MLIQEYFPFLIKIMFKRTLVFYFRKQPPIELKFVRVFPKSVNQTLIRVRLCFFNVGKSVKAFLHALSVGSVGFVSFKKC
jgi:hypothetical protein